MKMGKFVCWETDLIYKSTWCTLETRLKEYGSFLTRSHTCKQDEVVVCRQIVLSNVTDHAHMHPLESEAGIVGVWWSKSHQG